MVRHKRVSVTLPPDLAAFLTEYQHTSRLKSRSAAVGEAIRALRERELDAAYQILGAAQESGIERYPADNGDGLAITP